MRIFNNKLLIVAILLLVVAFIWVLIPADEFGGKKLSRGTKSNTKKNEARQTITSIPDRKKVAAVVEDIPGEFSPEMRGIVQGIQAGRTIHLRVDDFEGEYVFRSIDITEDRFQISTGPESKYPASYEVFEGRQILEDGSLSSEAKLAVVNDTLSIAFTNEKGDFLIERNEDGEMVATQLTSTSPDSKLGAWVCQHNEGIHGISDNSDNAVNPVTNDIEIVLGTEVDTSVPEISQALTSEPFYRLGKDYDASLRDISMLMVSGSTQTGSNTSANLSTRAASYFTYTAFVADIYERQLGLRLQLQELILIAEGSGQPDVELPSNEIDLNGNTSLRELTIVSDWCARYRPQETYQWGHATAWTNVGGAPSGTVGVAFVARYGSSTSGLSVNERNSTWQVLIHELGHNVGAAHTSGGAMNPSLLFSQPESFFNESEDGSFTAAKQIYDYMSPSNRAFVTGPADLRNPDEMPFAVDDFISTPTNTPVTFTPLQNDLQATPLFGITNNLRLVEAGQIFPKAAGSLTILDDEITFSPASGYTGRVWFTYTLGGNVGNGGRGWLHSADVVITVGGNNSDPDQNPPISITNDIVRTDFSGDVRLNPLLNDEGVGRLWAEGVDAINSITPTGTAQSYSEGAFSLVSAQVLTGNGSVSLETANVTRNGLASRGNTGYLVYTPSANEPNVVQIQYTVRDANGNQATGMISLVTIDAVSISTNTSMLSEPEGRVATILISRTGLTSSPERINFSISGEVDLTGGNSDVAIAGFDTFDASSGNGEITIPAGQSSAVLQVSAMQDSIIEGSEVLTITLTGSENLVINTGSDTINLIIRDAVGVIFSENFENFPMGTGLANGWNNEDTSPGVWTADSDGTPSNNTGPSVDNTTGAANGTYLYREATNNLNQQADLTSPVIDLTGTNEPTLEFYYHRFGVNLGNLHVDVFSAGVWQTNVMPALTGQQQISSDAAWIRSSIDISNFKTPDFQIRFRGLTTLGFQGDMAIDDVAIIDSRVLATESPVIEGQPVTVDVLPGGSAYFSVAAMAFPSPTYQWRRNGQAIPNATRSSYYIQGVSQSDVGQYTCVVTSGLSVTSLAGILSIGVEDTDGDGLDDAWERSFFGDIDELGTSDSDNDGVVNLLERAFGTAPNESSDKSLPTAAIMENAEGDFLSLTYRRLEGGAGTTGVNYTIGGIRYTVEYDSDLVGPWSSGDIIQIGSAVSNGDGTETVTVRVPSVVADGNTLFMRVMITPAL